MRTTNGEDSTRCDNQAPNAIASDGWGGGDSFRQTEARVIHRLSERTKIRRHSTAASQWPYFGTWRQGSRSVNDRIQQPIGWSIHNNTRYRLNQCGHLSPYSSGRIALLRLHAWHQSGRCGQHFSAQRCRINGTLRSTCSRRCDNDNHQECQARQHDRIAWHEVGSKYWRSAGLWCDR